MFVERNTKNRRFVKSETDIPHLTELDQKERRVYKHVAPIGAKSLGLLAH